MSTYSKPRRHLKWEPLDNNTYHAVERGRIVFSTRYSVVRYDHRWRVTRHEGVGATHVASRMLTVDTLFEAFQLASTDLQERN